MTCQFRFIPESAVDDPLRVRRVKVAYLRGLIDIGFSSAKVAEIFGYTEPGILKLAKQNGLKFTKRGFRPLFWQRREFLFTLYDAGQIEDALAYEMAQNEALSGSLTYHAALDDCELTPQGRAFLELLLARPGQVKTFEQIRAALLFDEDIELQKLKQRVAVIKRQAARRAHGVVIIRSHLGIGYSALWSAHRRAR